MLSWAVPIAAAVLGAALGLRIVRNDARRVNRRLRALDVTAGVALGGLLGYGFAVMAPMVVASAQPVVWSREVVQIRTADELQAFLESPDAGQPALVDFYASWCGPCRAMAPHIRALAEEGHAVAVVDVDQSPDLAQQYGVEFLPTLFVFRDGAPIHRDAGYHSLESLRELAAPAADLGP